jgi:uncharacterized alkaline shock family protein YloU
MTTRKMEMKPQDTITIAPNVLITIVSHAALQVPGVARMGTIPIDVVRLLKGNPMGSGTVLEISGNTLSVELYVVVKPGATMRNVSREAQEAISRSVQELVGMEVMRVNVHIDDVDSGASGAS